VAAVDVKHAICLLECSETVYYHVGDLVFDV